MTIIKHIAFLLCTIAFCGCARSSNLRTLKSLHNPTEYSFKADVSIVRNVLFEMSKIKSTRNRPWGVTFHDGRFMLIVLPHTSSAYSPVEDRVATFQEGKIGEVQGRFSIEIHAFEGRTRVSVRKEKFVQLVKKTFRPVPHPDFENPTFKEIPSNSYFEYLFLHELGEKVKEDKMPDLKGP